MNRSNREERSGRNDLGSHLFPSGAKTQQSRKPYHFGDDDDVSSFASDDSFVDEFFSKLDHRKPSEERHGADDDGSADVGALSPRAVPSYVRGKSGVAKRPEVDEVDGRDFAFKVKALYRSLTDDMRDAIAKHRGLRQKRRLHLQKIRGAAAQDELEETLGTAFDQECLQRGVDAEALRDLKVAFSLFIDGVEGVQEKMFMDQFGRSLCNNLTDEEISLWFRSIDANCSGAVSWPELAEFLCEYRQDAQSHKAYFVDFTIEGTGTNHSRRMHKQLVTRMLYGSSLDLIYTFAPDGLVKAWEPTTLRSLAAPVHALGNAVADVSLTDHNNRMMVLQSDRSIFVYDTFLDVNREPQHQLFRGFATVGKSARTLHDGTSFYEPRDKKKIEKARAHGSGPAPVPVSLLAQGPHNFSCIDDLGGSSHGEPVCVGTEGGTVELYNLILGSVKPITPFSVLTPHTDWVTWLQHTPEMLGVLTASLDGSLAVTDLESGSKLQTMALPSRKPKPVYTATYHRHNNTLVSCVGRTLHVWNALTGAHLTALSDHDALITSVAINADRQHIYALQENKTVKVWDLRTWRSVGEAEDTLRRAPYNAISDVLWCESNSLLVCSSTVLFGWRPTDVQEKLDAGLKPTDVETRVHLSSVVGSHCINRPGHIWTVDAHRCFVWGADGKHLMRMWKWPHEDDTITTTALDLDELQAVVGTERGRIWWVNYTNGYVVRELKHSLPPGHVTSAIVTKGIVESAPHLVYATIGRSVLAWSSDRTVLTDMPGPTFSYTLPASVRGTIEAVVQVSEERKLMGVVTSFGESVILTIGLGALATFALDVTPRSVTVDAVIALMPGVIAIGCSDGMVRVQGFYSSQDHRMINLAEFRGSCGDEGVTALFRDGRNIFVGDGDGCISVFECSKLLDERYIGKEVLPFIGEAQSKMARNTCEHFTDLREAFRAHDTAVVSIGISAIGELITGSTDKHIRAWRRHHNDFSFSADVGRQSSDGVDFATASNDVSRSAVTGRKQLPPVGTKLKEAHPFHDVVGVSIIAIPGDNHDPFLPQLSPAAGGSRRGTPPPNRSRRPSVSVLGRTVKTSKTPQPRVVGNLNFAQCFKKTTERVIQVKRGALIRTEPHVSAVHDQLNEVHGMKSKRAQEVREETKRAFNILKLPGVASKSVLSGPGTAAEKLLVRHRSLAPIPPAGRL